jgi:hypothetical protein
MSESSIEALCALIEEGGYQGARRLMHDVLIPLAKQRKISLLKAVFIFADSGADQDTSAFQLSSALLNTPEEKLRAIDINEPLT